MYGLTNDLVNAALADRMRQSRRVELENAVAMRAAGNGIGIRRLAAALRGALGGGRRSERTTVARQPVAAG